MGKSAGWGGCAQPHQRDMDGHGAGRMWQVAQKHGSVLLGRDTEELKWKR